MTPRGRGDSGAPSPAEGRYAVARQDRDGLSLFIAVVCVAVGAVIFLGLLLWKALAWWLGR